MELFKTVREYLMALYLSLQLLRFRYISIKLNGKLIKTTFYKLFRRLRIKLKFDWR